LGLLALSFTYSKKDLIKKTSGIMIICVAFLLAFSLSAAVGTALCGILFLLIRRKIFKNGTLVFIPSAFLLISLILPFVSTIVFNNKINFTQNIKQRLDLSSIA